jgi:alpha-D-ribose 1-methylphosphonate 5-phosphate C-P lyase
MFVCSDSHHCETRREAGHRGTMLADASALHLVEEMKP